MPHATAPDPPRVLLPIAGALDSHALELAIELAQEDAATLVAVYLSVVPLRYDEDVPLPEASWLAAPLLDAVERAGLEGGVRVTTRIATGRALRHALARLWARERFTQIVAGAPAAGEGGFTEDDLAWLVANAPAATYVVKPAVGAAA